MKDFLSFRKMITPVIITIIFWIGVSACVIGGIVMIVDGARMSYGGAGTVGLGLGYIFLGPIVVRVYCEILIIIFRINETLTEIKNNIERKA
ncbi:MAG: DUF4282 domain-containing protein [Actinomycetota bacterium]|nr:DUF4282 domain-containing protein [Actinomycetota bacterium]